MAGVSDEGTKAVTPDVALCIALVSAQAAAKSVAKGSTNSFHRYSYASADAMIAEARDALSSAGLALVTTEWVFHPAPPPVENGVVGRMSVEYLLVHVSGGTRVLHTSTAVFPEKGRPQDKAEAAALTHALGYLLRGLLLLPREEEDANPDRRDDRGFVPQTRPAPVELTIVQRVLSHVEKATTLERITDIERKVVADEDIPDADKPGLLAACAKRRLALTPARTTGNGNGRTRALEGKVSGASDEWPEGRE